jgi:hypothetical protein
MQDLRFTEALREDRRVARIAALNFVRLKKFVHIIGLAFHKLGDVFRGHQHHEIGGQLALDTQATKLGPRHTRPDGHQLVAAASCSLSKHAETQIVFQG